MAGVSTFKSGSCFGGRAILLAAVSNVALCLGAGLPAYAQDTATQTADTEDTTQNGETIVVTGIRRSLQSSQTIRRNADTVVDAITAEDIGALPDRSVAEALQRVPGVNITRFAKTTDPDRFSVEGSGVIIRGLPFVRSELNGRDVFSATGGRILSFNDVSPELLAGVQVYKNATADMIDGGIAGTVNLQTRKPLDTHGPVFAGTIEGNYGDLRQEWSPSISLLASNQFESRAGTFGLQAGYAYSELLSRSDATQITDPCYRDPTQIGVYTDAYTPAQQCLRVSSVDSGGVIPGQNFTPDNFPPAGSIIVPQGAGARTTTYDRDREAISLVAQWESPDRTLMVTGEYLRAEAKQLLSEYAVLALVNGNIPSQPAFGTNWTYDSSGDFLSGQLTNVAWRGEANCGGTFTNAWSIDQATAVDFPCVPTSGFSTEMLRFEQERTSTTEDASLSLKWDPNEQWSFNAEVQHIQSDLHDDSIITVNQTFQDIFIDLGPKVPIVQFVPPSTADGSSNGAAGAGLALNPDYTYYEFALDSRIRNEGDLTSVRGDGEFRFADQGGFLKSVRFGARWAERNRVTRDTNFSNWGALSAPWGGCCQQFGAARPFNAIYASDFPQFVEPTSPFQDFQRGKSPVPFAGGLFWGGGRGDLINAYQSGDFQTAAGTVVSTWEADTFAAGGYVIPGWVDVSRRPGVIPGSYFRDGEISDVTEDTSAFYARLDFGSDAVMGGMSLEGNVGLRYVATTVQSGGQIGFPILGQFPFLTDLTNTCNVPPGNTLPPVCKLSPARLQEFLSIANGQTVQDNADIRFDNWLPSLNAKLEFAPGQLFRLGISKGIFRPDLASYRTGGTIGDNLAQLDQENTLETGTLYTVRTGNRLLEATESWNYDLSYEWYWADVGSLTFSVFYKSITGIETGGVSLRNFTNGSGDQFEVLVNGPSNDGAGDLKGFEVSYLQVYDMLPAPFNHLGVQASYTYVDGSDFSNTTDVNVVRQAIAAQQPFAGISQDTVNLAVFYEDDKISARLAYNWRSDYLSTPRDDIFPYAPIFVEAGGQLDGSVFYTLNDHFKVGVQGVNLLDEITETTQVFDFAGTRGPRSFFRNDRRYSVSVRFNF